MNIFFSDKPLQYPNQYEYSIRVRTGEIDPETNQEIVKIERVKGYNFLDALRKAVLSLGYDRHQIVSNC